MFTELHFKHKTVCQLITELLQSPFRDNGDTNIITFFPKISVIVKLRNLFITKTCFLSFFLFPNLSFQQSEIWLNMGHSNPCSSNCEAVITIQWCSLTFSSLHFLCNSMNTEIQSVIHKATFKTLQLDSWSTITLSESSIRSWCTSTCRRQKKNTHR